MFRRRDESTSPAGLCAIIAIVYGILGFSPVLAADFSVNPLRVYLDKGHTTESIKVRNDHLKELTMQLRAYTWSQDEEGRDVYEPTGDLVFFPKLLTLEPGQTRLVRVGVPGAPPDDEESYRIYLEELPDTREVPKGQLRTLLRVGVPVFRRPLQQQQAGDVIGVELIDCRARFRFANRGNTHIRLKKVVVRALGEAGDEIDSGELKGWYVLAGRDRFYEYTLSEDICTETQRIEVNVESEQGSFVGVTDGVS
jgi:fimbrial chaperone protein